MDDSLKIIGFSQLRNELEKGNLENWFKCMSPCSKIYIFDQNSTDGSLDYYKKFNTEVIASPINRFEEELVCKSELLKLVYEKDPDFDWIYWIDGDTLIDGRLLRDGMMNTMLSSAKDNNIDSIFLGHYNLWRSDIHYRVDSRYHEFNQVGRMVFWRNTGKLSFPTKKGLHQSQHPGGISNGVRCIFNLIHRGFATDDQIITRYNLYKSKGQKGNDLDRLIDETTLKVEIIPKEELPDWYDTSDSVDPILKPRLKV